MTIQCTLCNKTFTSLLIGEKAVEEVAVACARHLVSNHPIQLRETQMETAKAMQMLTWLLSLKYVRVPAMVKEENKLFLDKVQEVSGQIIKMSLDIEEGILDKSEEDPNTSEIAQA